MTEELTFHLEEFEGPLELVRGGRVTLGPKGELTMQRGRLPREKAKEEE